MLAQSDSWCEAPDGYGRDMSLERPPISYFRCDQKGGNATLINIDVKKGTLVLFENG